MDQVCRHCSTIYDEASGVDGFCCAGCKTVDALIQQEGFSDYYRMQDRVAEPVKDRHMREVDSKKLSELQANLERSKSSVRAAFMVSGMSCMGCVWLVQKISSRQKGVTLSEVSLTGQTLELEWQPEVFSLSDLAIELRRFGYLIQPSVVTSSQSISALSVRCGLSFVFTLNLAVLSIYQEYVGAAITMLNLLCAVCSCFVLILGGGPFFMSSYRSMQLRRFHSDWLPVGLIVIVVFLATYWVLLGRASFSVGALIVSTVVALLILCRWLASRLTGRWG